VTTESSALNPKYIKYQSTTYPLVNIQKTDGKMTDIFMGFFPLYQWPFSSSQTVSHYQYLHNPGISWPLTRLEWAVLIDHFMRHDLGWISIATNGTNLGLGQLGQMAGLPSGKLT
jgi:hypothetical protein